MRQGCSASEADILATLAALQGHFEGKNESIAALVQNVTRVVGATMTLTLSNERHAKASQTWGMRNALMSNIAVMVIRDCSRILKEGVAPDGHQDKLLKELIDFWSQDIAIIHQSAMTNSEESAPALSR